MLMNFLEFVRSSDCWDGRGRDNRKQELVKSAGEVEECKGLGNEPGRGGGWGHTWADTFLRKDSITG